MLTHRVHWQNASKRDPFWEARLVWFAKTPKPGGTPDNEDEYEALPKGAITPPAFAPDQNVKNKQKQTTDAFREALAAVENDKALEADYKQRQATLSALVLEGKINLRAIEIMSARNPEKAAAMLAQYFVESIPAMRRKHAFESIFDNSPDKLDSVYLTDFLNLIPELVQARNTKLEELKKEFTTEAEKNNSGDLLLTLNEFAEAKAKGHMKEEILLAANEFIAPAMEKRQEKKLLAEQVELGAIAKTFETMAKNLQDIIAATEREDVRAYLNALSPDNRKLVDNSIHELDESKLMLIHMQDAAARLDEWKKGSISPQTFRAFMERFAAYDPAKSAQLLGAFDSVVNQSTLAPKVEQWNNGALAQESDKREIIETVWIAIDGNGFKSDLVRIAGEWSERVVNVKAVTEKSKEEVKKNKTAEENEKSRKDGDASMGPLEMISYWRQNGVMGMQLYSAIEVYRAFKKVGTAWHDAREDYVNKRANKLAFGIGKVMADAKLPFGDVMQERLSSTLESEFSKEKNDYKGQLGDDSFGTLLEKFKHLKYDSPKAIGILEVAAGHGWLYEIADMSDERVDVNLMGENYLSIVPPHWDEAQTKNYLNTLRRQNTAGGKEERGKWADRVREQTDPNIYIKKFNDALNANNYQGAIGIADAFIGRGKMQEVDAYLTLRLINHLRTDPNARKYLTAPVLEQFAVQRWGQATAMQNNIAFQLPSVNNLRNNPNAMEGYLLGTIQKLEEDIRRVYPTISDEEMVKETAKIMSGQTVKINGQKFTLFTERYRDYWDDAKNDYLADLKGEEVFKTEADYLGPGSKSALILIPTKTASAVLKTDTTGQFKNQSLATAYVQRVVSKLDELEGTEAEATFRQMMKERFAEALKATFNDRAPGQVIRVQLDSKEGFLGALVKRNIVDRTTIKELVGSKPPEGFWEELEKQAAAPKEKYPKD